jgi:hypothetical protein
MGTRAGFYIGRGKEAEWLGSIAWDGYPGGLGTDDCSKGRKVESKELLSVTTESEWRSAVKAMLESRNDATFPKDGWPWPWEDSGTTDYAYAFDGGKVYYSGFGGEWQDPLKVYTEEEQEAIDAIGKTAVFPSMKSIQKVTFGGRSGLIIVG